MVGHIWGYKPPSQAKACCSTNQQSSIKLCWLVEGGVSGGLASQPPYTKPPPALNPIGGQGGIGAGIAPSLFYPHSSMGIEIVLCPHKRGAAP